MGVDLQKIKERAQEEEAKAFVRSAGAYRYWTPKQGKNLVRLMPPWTGEGPNKDSFYREAYMHFQVGLDEDSQKMFPCIKKSPNGPNVLCPVCSYVDKLRATGTPSDDELALNMRAKQRFYTNVIDHDDPVFTEKDVAEWKANQQDKTRECLFSAGESKVQVWAYGPMVWNDLMNIFTDAGIDVTDMNAGHNVIVTREGEKRRTKYSVRADFKASSFSFKGDVSKALYDMDKIVTFSTPQQMNDALAGMDLGGTALPAATNGSMTAPSLPAPAVARLAAPQAQLPVVSAAPAVEPPPCFRDKKTVSSDDPECTGGTTSEGSFDPCPFFQPCLVAKQAAMPPKPVSRRAAKHTVPLIPETSSSIDELEADMRNALNQKE